MTDWSKSMTQTFEYYTVNPNTWKDVDLLTNVKSATISRDSTAETLGSANFDIDDDIGECYIRAYLKVVQNGITERIPLGTFLLQTQSSTFNGKRETRSINAYTPLIELKENPPELGYTIFKGENIMDNAKILIREHARAPVVPVSSGITLYGDFVANSDDTWLSFLSDLIGNAKYGFGLDELGQIIFSPKQDSQALQPVWTFTSDNSSILHPGMQMERDLYGIPNVLQVIYTKNNEHYETTVKNTDSNSPVSIQNRGREITKRITDPDIGGTPTKEMIYDYAKAQLKALSTLTYTISYTHGYCPVRVGDCVRFMYPEAGLKDVKAKVISQSISCTPGCSVSEKATYTVKLWG